MNEEHLLIAEPARRGVEYVACTVCGSADGAEIAQISVQPHHRGVYGRDQWPLLRCRTCGLHYHNPRIDAAARAAFYQFTIPGERDHVQRWFVENADLHRSTWQRVARILSRYAPSGKLLDVGCGPGWFLDVAREAGYTAVGQDVSPVMVELANTLYQLPVAATIAEAVGHHGHFDLATCFDVIEHHEDPLQMLREIHAALRPGGLLMLTTHDIGNPFARLYGTRWRQLHPIGHLNYFDRETMALILDRAGFEVVRFGGWHTIAESPLREAQRWVSQSLRTLVLRSLFIAFYAPLAHRIAPLRKWQLRLGARTITHEKLMLRVGDQIIMNDDLVVIARTRKTE